MSNSVFSFVPHIQKLLFTWRASTSPKAAQGSSWDGNVLTRDQVQGIARAAEAWLETHPDEPVCSAATRRRVLALVDSNGPRETGIPTLGALSPLGPLLRSAFLVRSP